MFSPSERATIEEVYDQYDLGIPFEQAYARVVNYVRQNLKGRPAPKAYDAAHHVFSSIKNNQDELAEIHDIQRRAGIK